MVGGRNSRYLRLVAAVLVALVASACGSTPDEERVSLSLSESPINEMLGIDIALRAGDLVELERSAERGVVECMKAEGFEYIAVDFASQFEPESGAEDPDSRNYAELNGYGISIRPTIDAAPLEDAVDPNEQVRSTLSASELEAYQLALYGDAPLDDESVSLADRTGCVATAYDAVYAARGELGAVEQFFGEFGPELAALEERFMSDPRFVELEGEWSTCMIEKGFNVAARNEIFIELDRRMSEVTPLIVRGEDPSAEAQEAMDAVGDWERSAAVADWDCTQPVQDGMRTLRYGYEALFLEENEGRISGG